MIDSRYKALLIGNGTFEGDPHKLSALKGPANDLRLMREALTHPKAGLFEAANVRDLLDRTHGEVLEAIDTFFGDAGPEDHLLFYYSGHGYPDTNNNLYLCARDTLTTKLVSSAIPDKTINLMAENSRARKFFFILDCCHSGGFKGGADSLLLAHGSGRCLITSCASDQLSADAVQASGASTFTHFLAHALTEAEVDADGDGIVLTSEVFRYVQPRVYNATKQTVQWTMDKTFGEAAIATTTPRRKKAAAARAEPPPSPPAGRPVLEVSETRIEFRDVQPGETLPVERIDVVNSGDGTLDWVVECDEPWIKVTRKDDSLLVTLDTTTPGLRRGNFFVRDRGRGGSRTVRVLLHVVEAATPRLAVSPQSLDFGTRIPGPAPKLEINVSNVGPGHLDWEIESAPSELVVSRHDQGFSAEIAPSFSGTLKGTLRIKSNGGDLELPVTGTVAPPAPVATPPPLPPPLDPLLQALPGWWMNDAGAINIKLEGGALVYFDHNLMGVKVGQGTIQVQNGMALLQGFNSFSGAYTGQVTVQGQMLTGSLMVMGRVAPVIFMRQQPWFAAFAG